MAKPSQVSSAVAETALTAGRIAELRRLHEAATAGPWEHRIGPTGWDIEARGDILGEVHGGDGSLVDAKLLVAARNALPDLLDEAEAQREAIRAYIAVRDEDRIDPGEFRNEDGGADLTRFAGHVADNAQRLYEAEDRLRALVGVPVPAWRAGVSTPETDQ